MTRRGRPSISKDVRELVLELHRHDMTPGQITKKLWPDVSESSVRRILREVGLEKARQNSSDHEERIPGGPA